MAYVGECSYSWRCVLKEHNICNFQIIQQQQQKNKMHVCVLYRREIKRWGKYGKILTTESLLKVCRCSSKFSVSMKKGGKNQD